MSNALAAALEPVLDFVFPPRCPSCGAGVGRHGGLCAECWAGLAIPAEPWCAACQRPFGGHGPAEAGAICAPCLAHSPRHAGIFAATLYTPVSRKLVLAFKHGRRIAMAPMLARLIAARLPADGAERLIAPVPLHRWRLWSRGYNQAALLAHQLEKLGKGAMLVWTRSNGASAHPRSVVWAQRRGAARWPGRSVSARARELSSKAATFCSSTMC